MSADEGIISFTRQELNILFVAISNKRQDIEALGIKELSEYVGILNGLEIKLDAMRERASSKGWCI